MTVTSGSTTQRRVAIVGASGMVGGLALRYMLDHPNVRSVTSIGRKSLSVVHPKLQQVLHLDFADASSLAQHLSNQDALVYCLGAYTGTVSDPELRKITVDYTVEFSRVLHQQSPDSAFSFLSGGGADPTVRSRIPFARYKGMAENGLLAAGFPRLYVFRAAYIYPVEARREPNFGYRILRAIYPVIRIVLPNQVIAADSLARVMVDLAVADRPPEHLVLENRDIRALSQIATYGV